MKYLLALLLSFPVFAQPLKYPSEILFETSNDINNVKKPKISVSILSGNVGKTQVSGIFRISGDKDKEGKLGGQIWRQITPYFLIGYEAVSNLKFDTDHQILIALEYKKFGFDCFTYTSIHLLTEHIGSVGSKCYIKNNFSLNLEYLFDHKKNDFLVSVGVILPTEKTVKQIESLFDKIL